MELREFIDNWNREFRRCGACLSRAGFGSSGRLHHLEFRIATPPALKAAATKARYLRVSLWGVKDWVIRPSRALAGTHDLELVADDPLLSPQRLRALDSDDDLDGPEQPLEHVELLRHGPTYVIARQFDAEWLPPDEGTTPTATNQM